MRRLIASLSAGALLITLAACSTVAIAGSGPTSAPHTAPASPSELGETGPGDADGVIDTGTWVILDDDIPAITNLDPAMRDALERAQDAAASDPRNITFSFTSAWRSEQYQDDLFAAAVTEYGSEEAASEWVKPGAESKHVSGIAVDLATADAMDWLSRFGAEFGLCQIYAHENWHFELIDGTECPEQISGVG